ncbi:tetraacyldisaccharide 4'-kinase [uncultured Marinobacter sp.]|uniref:tetraacyldisaccharide 4'-kinase n=1 Tax=uncultured Marinobacter sp. TaxID=187379 RepID=UPI0030DA190C
MTGAVDRLWYGRGRPLWPLWPAACLYRSITRRRRDQLQQSQDSLPVPVIVVGNITAGGTGKSPLTAWLVHLLQQHGWRPVILTRGYGAKGIHAPVLVTSAASADQVGDEPLMLAAQTGCPVVVDPDRLRGARWALQQELGNILVCDDGLQHYRLPRTLEIAVFDGARGVGNGAPIPVGPLREPVSRLQNVDFVVVNGAPGAAVPGHDSRFTMNLEPVALTNLMTAEQQPLSWLSGRDVSAVAGIGNPERFFATLRSLGARVTGVGMPDHHRFRPADLLPGQGPVIITAKDAVKARQYGHPACWILEVEAQLPDSFGAALLARLNGQNLNGAGPRASRQN